MSRTIRSGSGFRAGALFSALLMASACPPHAYAHQGAAHAETPEAGAEPDFTPPAVGTYELHHIMAAPEGQVLGLDGRAQPLSAFTRGRITLLGFIYTTCTDPAGCPLAYKVFGGLKDAIGSNAAMRDKVRLVTLSFDPARDTPDAMRRYAGSYAKDKGSGPSWYFLTTKSARELLPLVEGFGQDVRVTYDRSGKRPRRELSHVLKVFLIDGQGDIREIYTSNFLYPRLVLNDIETLLREDAGQTQSEVIR